MQEDNRSILHLYKNLISLRKETPTLNSGDYEPLRSRSDVLCYKRFSETETFTVALNLTHEARAIGAVEEGALVISTLLDRTGVAIKRGHLLRPDEGIIFRTR
jgi:alpha-glucosidase